MHSADFVAAEILETPSYCSGSNTISTQTYASVVASDGIVKSQDSLRVSGRAGKILPFIMPDRDELYVAIFCDNPLLMKHEVEQSGGRVVYSATAGSCSWKNRNDVMHAFRKHTVDMGKTLIWVHWGEGLHQAKGRTRKDSMQACASWLKRQSQEGGLAVMDAISEHWPYDSKSEWTKTSKNLSSCNLGLSEPCVKFSYVSSVDTLSGNCSCRDADGRSGDSMALFSGLVKHIFDHPMVPTSSSHNTSKQILEDVGGDITVVAPVQAYPTEQAVRQKEAKKRMKEELEAKGVSQEEIKRLTKRKPQKQ